jgi:hypothetical protein
MAEAATQTGKRRPKPEDLDPLLEAIWGGKSFRAACGDLGLDPPSTNKWLHDDDARRQQYARACEGGADYRIDDALALNRAAALGAKVNGQKVDASGAKGYLAAVQYANGRMAPKGEPEQRVRLFHEYGRMSDDELDAAIAAREAELKNRGGQAGNDADAGEP